MSDIIQVDLDYTPRPLQAEIHKAIANNGNRIRFAALAIHRRFGKTVCAVAECINIALNCPHRKPQVFYICPTYKQAANVAWAYIKDLTRPIPGMRFKETDLSATFPTGAKIQLLGGENYDTMRGNYIDLAVIDEMAQINPLAWRSVIRPALADRLGSCIILGTPQGKDHFYDIYQEALNDPVNWIARTYRADETGILSEAELALSRKTMGEEEYRQEMLCDWAAAVRGSYYGLEMDMVRKQGRITNVPHARILPVDVSFDLGMDDATAAWFIQSVGQEIRFIDYKEWQNTSLQDILLEMSREPYVYGTAILPHDAQVREFSTGRTRVETFEESSLFQSVEVAKRLKIEDGISATRQIFPQFYFDQSRCAKGIDSLENYRKQYDAKLGTYKNKPIHDKFSHGADAMRYLGVHYNPQMGEARERSLGRTPSGASYMRRQQFRRVHRATTPYS